MNAAELSRKGLSLFQAGKFKEALGVYKEGELVSDTPTYRAFFCQNQGIVHTRLGDVRKAKILLQKAYEDIKDEGFEYCDEGKLIAEAIWQIKQYEEGKTSQLNLFPVVINDDSSSVEAYEFEDSEAISMASFDHSDSIVKIVFKDGSSYSYDSISHELFQELVNARSKGSFFNQKINRRHFPLDDTSSDGNAQEDEDGLFLPGPGSSKDATSFLPNPSYMSPEEKLRAGAASGDPDSMFQYACHIESKVIRRSSLPSHFQNSYEAREVAELAKKAAAKGHTEAQYKYATMLQSGIGVTKSYGDAVYWFIQAATSGHRMSQYFLGSSYEQGHGVETNYSEAYAWYALASSNPKRKCYAYEISLESLLKLKKDIGPLTLAQGEFKFKELQRTTASHLD
jgi:tetratricopeptide (TPR) repeat protein